LLIYVSSFPKFVNNKYPVKPVLILQHQLPEKAAYLATWLDQHRIPYQIANAGAGQAFPATIEPSSALAVMGGGMSANDALLSNRQAEILILQAVLLNTPVIGHCLGGQLMSRALGGTVTASPRPEIGWQPIAYKNDPQVREWFGDRPAATVIHWHYESFSIPTGATLLAGSEACPNQAWAMGPHLAMQFHIEINESKIHTWVNDDDATWAAAREQYATVQDKIQMLAGIPYHLAQHQATADSIYKKWLSTTPWAGFVA
jgi:GMP synthase-like glutamine amidotransferase